MTIEGSPRVLHVLDWPGVGGIESLVLTLARVQSETVAGFLFYRDGPAIDDFRATGKPVATIHEMLRANSDPVHSLMAFCAKADLLHLHSMYLERCDTELILRLSMPALATLHSASALDEIHLPIVCVSEEIRRSIKSSEPVWVVENGVDCNLFAPNFKPHNLNATTLLRVCRPERSDPIFWPVVQRLLTNNASVKIWIVGEGGENTERIRFLGMRKDVPAIMNEADIFFYCPNRQEEGAHDVSVLEAMASGLAVVTTKVRGVRQSIDHLATGLLIEPQDEDGLVSALELLVRNSQMRKRLGAQARATALKRFNICRVAAEYSAIYDHIIKQYADSSDC